MREIEFRGKRVDNGEWVYGFYFEIEHNNDKTHVHGYITAKPLLEKMPESAASFIEVETKTVGQFTGLCDNNDNEIYEGDILFISRNLEEPDKDGDFYLAKWECCGFQFRKMVTVRGGEKRKSKPCVIISRAAIEYHSEIAGNIHENPELLEV